MFVFIDFSFFFFYFYTIIVIIIHIFIFVSVVVVNFFRISSQSRDLVLNNNHNKSIINESWSSRFIFFSFLLFFSLNFTS